MDLDGCSGRRIAMEPCKCCNVPTEIDNEEGKKAQDECHDCENKGERLFVWRRLMSSRAVLVVGISRHGPIILLVELPGGGDFDMGFLHVIQRKQNRR